MSISKFVRPQIAELAGYTPGEQPQDGKYIKLNTNENPYRCSPWVDEAIRETLERGLGKYPDATATPFRNAAAELYQVDPDAILCGNGSDDILTILTRTFVGEKETLRLPYPSYILYRTLAEIQGADWQEVCFQDDWSLGADFSEDKQNLKLVFLPNPNSPSGTVLSPERILEIAEQLPCPLVVDEAYGEFAERNCLHLVEQNEKIIVTRSLSKSYGLAGVRFGYAIAQPHIIAEMMKVKDSYNCDSLSIAAATAAISDQEWLEASTAKIIETRGRLTQEMRALGFRSVDSQANFVWNSHPEVRLKPLYQGLKEKKILIRYMDYNNWGDGLRVSVGSDDEIDIFLDVLKSLM